MKLAVAWLSPAALVFPLAAMVLIVLASGPGLHWLPLSVRRRNVIGGD